MTPGVTSKPLCFLGVRGDPNTSLKKSNPSSTTRTTTTQRTNNTTLHNARRRQSKLKVQRYAVSFVFHGLHEDSSFALIASARCTIDCVRNAIPHSSLLSRVFIHFDSSWGLCGVSGMSNSHLAANAAICLDDPAIKRCCDPIDPSFTTS